MIFNSFTFFCFFLIVFPSYWIINNNISTNSRNVFIILISYVFYGWAEWKFLGLIIVSSTINYLAGYLLYYSTTKIQRKNILISTILMNIVILLIFKYFNFFIKSFVDLTNINGSFETIKIILPIGISFYTFQALSYVVDAHKDKSNITLNVFSFFAFISFFPQLVAGPIEKSKHLIPQFETKKTFNYAYCVQGLRLVLWGLFKKIVIADNFGVLSDTIFNTDSILNGSSIIIGSIFFGLQIYCDFSGYSDIAIGIGRLLGFDLIKNFQTPYFSSSFFDFWRRWHISLSSWFKEYVYIPLGGNRKSTLRNHFNVFITFLLSGIWHGSNITFAIWGTCHGIVLIIEKQINIKKYSFIYSLIVLLIITILWIPFRVNNWSDLKIIFSTLCNIKSFHFNNITEIITTYSPVRFISLISITLLFFSIEKSLNLKDFNEWISLKHKTIRIMIYYILLLLIFFLGNFSVKPNFIYFQF
ncbi:MBOAT family O-acyltransferase [uncultured Cytophaga sp.]|uniref:MBOAT family O-acyltransferase n=1 Tax=uncultured Cytophaga sp. TaxID=160238 RepID=UPI0026250E1F|nr:MBOAT family O-acyltransferase [uncultured Cytophaga sp.]